LEQLQVTNGFEFSSTLYILFDYFDHYSVALNVIFNADTFVSDIHHLSIFISANGIYAQPS